MSEKMEYFPLKTDQNICCQYLYYCQSQDNSRLNTGKTSDSLPNLGKGLGRLSLPATEPIQGPEAGDVAENKVALLHSISKIAFDGNFRLAPY
jgi:hypothetical protein